MSDEEKTSEDDKFEALSQKIDRVLAAVETVSNQVIKLDQNVIVVAGRIDAIEPEVTQIKGSVSRVEVALVHVAQDVADTRDRVIDLGDDHGSRLRVLETRGPTNGRSNGHG